MKKRYYHINSAGDFVPILEPIQPVICIDTAGYAELLTASPASRIEFRLYILKYLHSTIVGEPPKDFSLQNIGNKITTGIYATGFTDLKPIHIEPEKGSPKLTGGIDTRYE